MYLLQSSKLIGSAGRKDAGRWAVSWLSLFHDQDLSIDVRFVVQGCRL